MPGIPSPNVRELLLPLLACLPTAFLSSRPPPALLPLLSPILRQRVHIRTSVTPQSSRPSDSSNWLNLLTWSPSRASRLAEIVSNLQLEPHPVSGELELFGDEEDEEAGRVRYRRLDNETLQARCEIREHGLAVIWVWCDNDNGGVGLPSEAISGEVQSGWRVAEVQPVESEEEEQTENPRQELIWRDSIAEAETVAATAASTSPSISRRGSRPGFLSPESSFTSRPTPNSSSIPAAAAPMEEADDDDYWASYDRTPNRTPMTKRSPAPQTPQPTNTTTTTTNSSRYPPTMTTTANNTSTEEDNYYARYGSVQPALDSHDPDEEPGTEEIESSLHQRQDLRHEYNMSRQQQQQQQQYKSQNSTSIPHQFIPSPPHSESEEPTIIATSSAPLRIHSPTPSRPSTSSSNSENRNGNGYGAGGAGAGRISPVAALEESAESASAAEVGVKQHISTEMKSLYRLARAAGIERSEFERVVRTELDVMGMLDE